MIAASRCRCTRAPTKTATLPEAERPGPAGGAPPPRFEAPSADELALVRVLGARRYFLDA